VRCDTFIKALLESNLLYAKQFCKARPYDKVSRNKLKHVPGTFHFTALILEPIIGSIFLSFN